MKQWIAALVAVAFGGAAAAQDYPSRPIRTERACPGLHPAGCSGPQQAASYEHNRNHGCALPLLKQSFLGPSEGISHHAIRSWAMLFLKPLFGFAASTSGLAELMVLLGHIG